MTSNKNYNQEIPYNDLPLLPLQAEIENMVILKKYCQSSIIRIKRAITKPPNPTLLIVTSILKEVQITPAFF